MSRRAAGAVDDPAVVAGVVGRLAQVLQRQARLSAHGQQPLGPAQPACRAWATPRLAEAERFSLIATIGLPLAFLLVLVALTLRRGFLP